MPTEKFKILVPTEKFKILIPTEKFKFLMPTEKLANPITLIFKPKLLRCLIFIVRCRQLTTSDGDPDPL